MKMEAKNDFYVANKYFLRMQLVYQIYAKSIFKLVSWCQKIKTFFQRCFD